MHGPVWTMHIFLLFFQKGVVFFEKCGIIHVKFTEKNTRGQFSPRINDNFIRAKRKKGCDSHFTARENV